MYTLVYCEGLRHLTSMLVFGSVWSDLLVLHNYGVILSEYQKVTFLGVKAKKLLSKNVRKKKLIEIVWNGENWSKMFLKFFFKLSLEKTVQIFDHIFFQTYKVLGYLTSMGGWPQRTRGSRRSRSACTQGRYVTQQGYAPLESTGMVAFGNQCKPFSIATPMRAKL